ncbi:hypothetical protein Dimus_014351 [Dionaea muscipula]
MIPLTLHPMHLHVFIFPIGRLRARGRLFFVDSYLCVSACCFICLVLMCFPRANSRNEMRHSDIYVLDKIIHGLGEREPIPLAPILIQEMREVVHSPFKTKALCFSVLISCLLRRAGVPRPLELRMDCGPYHILNGKVMLSLVLVHDGQVWRNPALGMPHLHDSDDSGDNIPEPFALALGFPMCAPSPAAHGDEFMGGADLSRAVPSHQQGGAYVS